MSSQTAGEPAGFPRLIDIVQTWWRARVRLFLLALGGLAVAGAVTGVSLLTQPVRQQSTLTFRLHFLGIEKAIYPNGMPFSPADIVAMPVRQEVYRRSRLSRLMDFPDFNGSFAVTQINAQTERLRREFHARMADRRLSVVERNRLEDEFIEVVANLTLNEFTLVFERSGVVQRWPASMATKIMEDTLTVWAEQTRSRGSFPFDENVFGENLLTQLDLAAADYPALLDRLQVIVAHIRQNLADLGAAPGARLLRVGEAGLSLGELEVWLDDDFKHRLRMIEAPVQFMGLSREPEITAAWLRSQVERLERESQKTASLVSNIGTTLASYEASRPGIARTGAPEGDGFIHRLLDQSVQQADNRFRQDLVAEQFNLERRQVDLDGRREAYEEMLASISRPDATRADEMEAWVQEQIATLLDDLDRHLGYARLLHAGIAQRNLQPSIIYSIFGPVEQRIVNDAGLRLAVMLPGLAWVAWVAGIFGWTVWREHASQLLPRA